MDGIQLEDLATAIGRHAFLVLGLLAAVLVVALVVVVVVGRWVVAHRAAIWPRRLTQRGVLAADLALGLTLSLALLAFLRLAEAVAGEAELARFDVALAQALHADATPAGIRVLRTLTEFGSGIGLAVIVAAITVALVVHRERLLALGWVVANAVGGLLNGALKLLYQRPRPSFADPVLVAEGWSFPSGHAMGTFVFSGMLVYVLLRRVRAPAARLAIVAAGLLWTLAIGFSRIYLGVHYFSDVLAGYAAGTVWLAFCIAGVELVRRRRRARATATDFAAATPEVD